MGKFPKYNYSIAQEKTNKNAFCAKLVFVYRNAGLTSIIRKNRSKYVSPEAKNPKSLLVKQPP